MSETILNLVNKYTNKAASYSFQLEKEKNEIVQDGIQMAYKCMEITKLETLKKLCISISNDLRNLL